MSAKSILSLLACATAVYGHGYVSNVVINGVYYSGYEITTAPYQSDPPTVIGWSTTATDLGYVAPDAYNSSDIICHRGSSNALGHATIAAGDNIFLQWNTWPESHHGPVMSYLASCGDSTCETVDKTTLEFFKIDEVGLVDGSTAPGTYGSDNLISNSNGWMVQIPSTIASGNYVLRHEIIALHSAENSDGAQNYPQCFNLEITGGGSDVPTGTLGTELYSEDDAGILVNIYVTTSTYVVPGPTMISGATEIATQSTSAITATGSATAGSGTAAAATGSTATTAAAAAATTSSAATTAAAATTSSSAATTFSTAVRSTSTSSASSAAAAATTSAAAAANDDSCSVTVHTVTVTA